MLTVLDALIPIFLKNVLKDRKAEMKDIRNNIDQTNKNRKYNSSFLFLKRTKHLFLKDNVLFH